MKVSLVGPMTGEPDWNYPAFREAARALRSLGHEVFNPAETGGGDTTMPRNWYMRASIGALLGTEAVVVLPGAERSEGARVELAVAEQLGLPVLSLALLLTPPAPCDEEWVSPDD